MHLPLVLRRVMEFVHECVRARVCPPIPSDLGHCDVPCSVSRRTTDPFLSFSCFR